MTTSNTSAIEAIEADLTEMAAVAAEPQPGSAQPAPTEAELAEKAERVKERRAARTKIETDLHQAELAVATLEERRDRVVIDGEDMDAFHRDLVGGRERILTLQAGLSAISGQVAQAERELAMAELEAAAAQTSAMANGRLKTAWAGFLEALQFVEGAAAAITICKQEIEVLNDRARAAGRKDLVINPLVIRAEVADMVVGRPLYAPRVVERNGSESDEAFGIRVDAARTQAQDIANRDDPFRVKGDRVMAMIETLAFDMDPFQRAANRRMIKTESFPGLNGEVFTTLRDATEESKVALRTVSQLGPFTQDDPTGRGTLSAREHWLRRGGNPPA